MLWIIICLFVLGLCFGSFASVLLLRLWDGISWKKLKWVLFGFSRCPKCKKHLHARNLIPVVSFILQKWKCEYCKKKIDRIYPVLEIGSAIIFVISFLTIKYFVPNLFGMEFIWTNVFWIITNWVLFSILIYDIREGYLHIPFWVFGLLLVLVPQCLWWIGDCKIALSASIGFGGFFYLIYRWSKFYMKWRYGKKTEWIGEWDAILAFLIGALMALVFFYHKIEYRSLVLLESFLVFIILSGVIGLILAGIELGIKKIRQRNIKWPIRLQTIAFFPAMIISFWILLLGGKQIIFMFFL